MSTQIFTSPQDNCKVDHIKVATLASSFDTADGTGDYDDSWAFIGGKYSWMSNPTNLYTTAIDGNIVNVRSDIASMAIILPVDIDINDVITLQGIANGKSDDPCQFLIGVSYVSCEEFAFTQIPEFVNVFTLISAQLFPAKPKSEFNVCFSLETTNVTLSAGTLLYVGVNCPTFATNQANCNFSYTLDITKSCAPISVITNVRIQNCCEQAVFEVISASTQNLPASGSFSDTEGNCWTIIETTSDPVDTVRFVDTPYDDCSQCLTFNPCPMNLVVQSCCSGQQESFTGSLPGIVVGQTFLDTYGFCWNVTQETSGPITGLVTVDSAYENCETCTLSPGACPQVYRIDTCCKGVKMYLYTTLELLGSGVIPGDTFKDQYGYCWQISLTPQPGVTVNGAFIQATANFGPGACETCLISANNCGNPVIYKVQNCCSGAIEYVEYNFGFNVNDTIVITTTVTPTINECYKVLDWDNTSTPTITIDTFDGTTASCDDCIKQYGCPDFYIAINCLTDEQAVFYGVYPPMVVYSFITDDGNCYISTGQVTSGPATITVSQDTRDCQSCLSLGFYLAEDCQSSLPNEVVLTSASNVGMRTLNSTGSCYTITTPTSGPSTMSIIGIFPDCTCRKPKPGK